MLKSIWRNDIMCRLSLVCFGVLSILLLGACGGNNGGEGSGNSNPVQDVSISLTSGEAIEQVEDYVKMHGGTITVSNAPYQESEVVRNPCSQIDVDTDPNKDDEFLARCKPVGGTSGAPYGFKEDTIWTTKCCRTQTIRLPDNGRWSTEYSRATDNWTVYVEFDIDSIEQIVSWNVDDDTGTVLEKK